MMKEPKVLPGTEYSSDLEAPLWVWLVMILYPSGQKYREYFMPLRTGGQPVRMRKMISRLEYRLNQEATAYRERTEEIEVGGRSHRRTKAMNLHNWTPPFQYRVIELFPQEHFMRPTLFDQDAEPSPYRMVSREVIDAKCENCDESGLHFCKGLEGWNQDPGRSVKQQKKPLPAFGDREPANEQRMIRARRPDAVAYEVYMGAGNNNAPVYQNVVFQNNNNVADAEF